jgi:hypothetical protein
MSPTNPMHGIGRHISARARSGPVPAVTATWPGKLD